MTEATNLSDTSQWLPLDGLAPGFDANKATPSDLLAGREITVVEDDGTRLEHRFTADALQWRSTPAGRSNQPAGNPTEGTDAYEAFEVDEELIYVQFQRHDRPDRAVSLFLDLRAGRTLCVRTAIADPEPGRTRVRQTFTPGVIEGVTVGGETPAPSTALIGRRVMWIYSSQHAYEHIYLSPHWYTWQCLAGPEKGLADTDENSIWQLRPGIHVFCWREKVVPCASVTGADHRNVRSIRSHGVLFGLDHSGVTPTHFTFGAYGRLLSNTVHPDAYDPANQ